MDSSKINVMNICLGTSVLIPRLWSRSSLVETSETVLATTKKTLDVEFNHLGNVSSKIVAHALL